MLPQVHRAGEKRFIDYAGPTIALGVNGQGIGRANNIGGLAHLKVGQLSL